MTIAKKSAQVDAQFRSVKSANANLKAAIANLERLYLKSVSKKKATATKPMSRSQANAAYAKLTDAKSKAIFRKVHAAELGLKRKS